MRKPMVIGLLLQLIVAALACKPSWRVKDQNASAPQKDSIPAEISRWDGRSDRTSGSWGVSSLR